MGQKESDGAAGACWGCQLPSGSFPHVPWVSSSTPRLPFLQRQHIRWCSEFLWGQVLPNLKCTLQNVISCHCYCLQFSKYHGGSDCVCQPSKVGFQVILAALTSATGDCLADIVCIQQRYQHKTCSVQHFSNWVPQNTSVPWDANEYSTHKGSCWQMDLRCQGK